MDLPDPDTDEPCPLADQLGVLLSLTGIPWRYNYFDRSIILIGGTVDIFCQSNCIPIGGVRHKTAADALNGLLNRADVQQMLCK
jgi:hypothetical protein